MHVCNVLYICEVGIYRTRLRYVYICIYVCGVCICCSDVYNKLVVIIQFAVELLIGNIYSYTVLKTNYIYIYILIITMI